MKKLILLSGLCSVLMLVGCERADDSKAEKEQAEQAAAQQKAAEEAAAKRPTTGSHGFILGNVTKVYGNLSGLEKSSISVTGKDVSGGGETVRLGEAIFGVHVQTTNGVYVIQFQGDRAVTLASMITVGTQLRFPRTFFVRQEERDGWADGDCDTEYPLFDKNKIGINGQRRGLLVWDQLIEINPTDPESR